MNIFLIGKIGLFVLFISYLIHYYSQKSVKFYVRLVVFLSWAITFSPLVLLPEDIYYSRPEQQGAETTEVNKIIHICWEATLWLSYFFGYLVIPLLQSFIEAGEFTTAAKWKRSIKVNVMFYVYLSIPAGLVVLALFFIDSEHGLLLLIILLGYGLVNVPRVTLRRGNRELWLKYSYFQIAVADEQRLAATYDFEEILNTVAAIENDRDVEPDLRAVCERMRKRVPPDVMELAKLSPDDRKLEIPEKVTESFIISLRQKMKQRIHELQRFERKWEKLTEYAVEQEDINESQDSREGVINYSFKPRSKGCCGRFFDRLHFIWKIKFEGTLMYIIGALFAIFSMGVLFLETTIFKIIRLEFKMEVQGYVASQLLVTIPLLYIAVCAYYGLFNFNFAGLYGLYPNKQTDPESLLFASANFLRIAYPLAYNFLMMIRATGTNYNRIMGNIDLESGIGGIFNNYFPIVLGVLVLANLFDIYGKILGGLGLSSFKFTENFNDDKIDEGRRLLQAEKTNIELRYRTKNNKRGDSYVAINDSDSDRRSNSYSQSPTRHHDSFSSL